MTNIRKYILAILISLLCCTIYAFEGGIPFIQHSDSIFGAYSVAIKDLNTSGVSIIGVAKMNGTKTSLLWNISRKDTIVTSFTSNWFGKEDHIIDYSKQTKKADSLCIFTHTMGINKKDESIMNSHLYIGKDYNNTVANLLSIKNNTEEPLVEYMVYDKILNASARRMVESFLAIKYGISLNQENPTDYINAKGDIIWNGKNNKLYNKDIAGIGRDDKTLLNKKRGSSIKSPLSPIVSTSQDLCDGMYLMWSHNGESPRRRTWSLSPTGEWDNTPCNFQFKIGGEENLPFLEKDEIYTMLIDSSGTGEFDTSSTISYPCQYIDSENIVFSNIHIPASQSHFTISKRVLTDEEKEKPYQYIFVHPSPSIDGNIFVECRLWEITPIEVQIYNVVGQPIFNGYFSNSNYYNVKTVLPVSGTYVIIIKIEESILTYKVVRS
ncbi:MAG: T9SS type A sorting domain-containing protein [Paludibacteraceae bacterium]|nr:T9SS type A sorting domain-containing protein [Paludibacteraceae bacterium]